MQPYKKARLYDGDGNIRKRWYVEYFYLHPDTKQWVRFKIHISQRLRSAAERREKARAIIRDVNRRLQSGYNPFYAPSAKGSRSIAAAMEYVLQIKEAMCRRRTFYTYRNLVKSFLQWTELNHLSYLQAEDMTFHHAMAFMDHVKLSGRISNRSWNYRLMHMKAFFNLLMRRDWITINPFQRIERMPTEQTGIVALTTAELQRINDRLPGYDPGLYLCACLVFYCFLRPAEIVRLKIEDVHAERRQIIIPGAASKNRKTEVVDIPDPLMDVLKMTDLDFPDHWHIVSRGLKPGEKQIAPTRIAGAWQKFSRENGISKTIYALKHTGVGMAIEAGISARDLQLQLRHSSLEMTQVYLDRFSRRPSEDIRRCFPTLGQPARKRPPDRFAPHNQTSIPFPSSN